MPIGEVLAQTYLGASWIVLGQSRWAWSWWRWMGITVVAGTVLVVVRDGLQWELMAGPISASTALGTFALGTYAWGQVFGLPRGLALGLGVGLTSRPIHFSNRLADLIDDYRSALKRGAEDAPSRKRQLRAALRATDAMARQRAPDEAWATLRDDLVAQYRRWISLLGASDTVGLETVNAQLAAIFERWAALNDAAAEQQRKLATPARQRRALVVWFAIAGTSSVLIGLARARAAWLILGGHDTTAAIAALVMLAAGVFAIGYAAKLALTR